MPDRALLFRRRAGGRGWRRSSLRRDVDLVSFAPRLTTMGQTGGVAVQGWDPASPNRQLRAVTGADDAAANGRGPAALPTAGALGVGNRTLIRPLTDRAEARRWPAACPRHLAVADHRARHLHRPAPTCRRLAGPHRGAGRAGSPATTRSARPPTRSRHRPATAPTLRGAALLVSELDALLPADGRATPAARGRRRAWSPATPTPSTSGGSRCGCPALSATVESAWAPCLTPMAGDGRGLHLLPGGRRHRAGRLRAGRRQPALRARAPSGRGPADPGGRRPRQRRPADPALAQRARAPPRRLRRCRADRDRGQDRQEPDHDRHGRRTRSPCRPPARSPSPPTATWSSRPRAT